MFQRILVPLDGSNRAEKALSVATRIAHATGGSIHLLQVISLQYDYEGGLAMAPLINEQMVASETAMATSYLQTIATSPELADIPSTTEVSFGIPAQYIKTTACSGEVDLVVLCSHGRTGFTQWVLGSVARSLAHESPIPTLVLRESDLRIRFPDLEAGHTLSALVPLDGSELAESVLLPIAHLVAALAAPAKGALHLVQVVKPIPTSTDEDFISQLNAETFQHSQDYLASVIKRLQTTGIEQIQGLSLTSSVELASDVAEALVQLAERRNEGKQADNGGYDLIAISTHGRHGLQRWVMGSVTERILATTQLPVLIVRPLILQ